jgi:hypothetical protein
MSIKGGFSVLMRQQSSSSLKLMGKFGKKTVTLKFVHAILSGRFKGSTELKIENVYSKGPVREYALSKKQFYLA